jgi:hypothetical protein
MAKYQYKVDYINSDVSQSELASGKAGTKIAQHVEEKINAYSAKGYELYNQLSTTVAVKRGCLEIFTGKKVEYITIITTVFRKEV